MTRMYVATETFTADVLDGNEQMDFTEGRSYVAEGHEVLRAFPGKFKPEPEGRVEARIREQARSPEHTEAGAAFHEPLAQSPTVEEGRGHEARDAGLRTIERHVDAQRLTVEAADRV